MKFNGFEWDDGNWPKCARHGVSKEEIEFVFSVNPQTLKDKNKDVNEARYNAVGLTLQGRYVFVVFTLRQKAGLQLIRPISARYMHSREIERYASRKNQT